jgi:hypothetical protein
LRSPAARNRRRMVSQAQRSRYFQEIARAFFDRRGAPFVLSSRDLVTIAAWEEQGIPLHSGLRKTQKEAGWQEEDTVALLLPGRSAESV